MSGRVSMFIPTKKKSLIGIIDGLTDFSAPNKHSNIFTCKWNTLQGKRILNKNILIENFEIVRPFMLTNIQKNPPVFLNARNVFFTNCHSSFHFHWIRKEIFPMNPIIFLDGEPCISVLDRGFEFYITEQYYPAAIKLANEKNLDTELICPISYGFFCYLASKCDIEEVQFDSQQSFL